RYLHHKSSADPRRTCRWLRLILGPLKCRTAAAASSALYVLKANSVLILAGKNRLIRAVCLAIAIALIRLPAVTQVSQSQVSPRLQELLKARQFTEAEQIIR